MPTPVTDPDLLKQLEGAGEGPRPVTDPDLLKQLDAPAEDVTAGMALRGIPVLGAYIPQAEAAIRAAAQPLTGVGEKGATYAERYAKNLPGRKAIYEQAERESPIASTALQMGGGAAALAPIGATALGARALGGAGTLGQRVLAGGTSGAAISAADALARGEDPKTAGGIGGAIGSVVPVVGAAAGRIGRTARGYVGAPTADDLAPAVDAGYTALRNSGVEFAPASVNRAIRGIATGSDIHPDLTPKTLRLLTEAQTATAPRQPGAMQALTGVQPTARPGQTFDDLDTLRKRLGAVARDYTNPTEQLAARDAIRGIDDYIANVTPADVLRGDASTIAATARDARGNAAAEFRLRAMNALRQRAEDQAGSANSGMNIENAYRQQLRAFIRPNNKGVSPAMKEGFTPQEINRLRVATRGVSFPNALRLVSNVLGGGHGIAAGAGLATSYQTGDPSYLAAVGAGYGGRRLSNAMMRNRAEMLSRMTAARSPLAARMGTGGPIGPPINFSPVQAGLIGMVPGAMGKTGGGSSPQYAGAQEYLYGPGEIEDQQAAAFNGPQGYPNFNWVNPAGVEAFLASGPMSKNIEDRRGELTPAEAAKYRRMWRIEGRAEGGRVEEDQPYLVGERGPELFVPEQDGTIDPFARAAARTGRRGRQEGAGTKFVEGGYGLPAAYRALDEGARRALESAGQLQRTGDQYDPAPVLQQALGAVGAPLVGPAQAGATLGAGAIRRAAIPQVAKAELKAAEAAPYPQYAEAYPPTAPPVLKTDPKTGKEYMGKVLSPEAEQFMKTREGVIADMGQGYQPYYDPAKRTLVDPSKYPGRNVDTLTLQPAKPETIEKYLKDIDAPITRERLRKAFERGTELGNADNWYFMGQLEKDFVKELGAKEGRKAFLDRFASGMAATTSGQNPTGNLLMSHYLNYLEQKGLPLPTAGHQIPSPVGGQYGISNVQDYARMREAGGYAGLGENQPKMHNFARSFIGDLDRAVMDDQMAKGMLGHAADPKLPDRARKQAFGLLERPLHEEAAAAGVRPGAYQDVAWAGFKGAPGKPMIEHVNDAIERTARLTGMSREEVVRRGLIRNEIPLYGFSAPVPTTGQEQR